MLTTLYTVLKVLVLFGATIFVHELGHYLVARWCGMVVDVFSIGFGPALWKRKIGDVTYKIGAIPFGGYVALPQMDPGGDKPADGQQEPRRLPRAAPWKKILVALSGVTGNMILAVILAYVVYWGGASLAPVETECVVGFVETNSAAYAAGLRTGDVLDSVNGQPVKEWEQFVLTSALYDRVDIEARGPAGEKKSFSLETQKFMGGRYVDGVAPQSYCYVLKVDPGSSADEAGIRPRDRILELAGVRLYSREHLIFEVNRHRDETVPARVLRDGETVQVDVRPRFDEGIGRARIGVVFNTVDVKRPAAQIKSHATLILRLLQALVTPREFKAAAESVGGPISIIGMFWLYAQTSFIMALWFTGLVNVNLAILNLLPIPILDGGHIVFALYELITRRRPSEKFVNAVANVFAVLLIALFILLTYRDIGRMVPLFRGDHEAAEAAATGAPPAEAEPAP